MDGNLVLYDHNLVPRWDTSTWNRGWYALFQSDGNLVVYDRTNSFGVHWATHTNS